MRLFKKRRPIGKQARPVGHKVPLIFEPLEPRVLLSADAVAGSIDGYDDDFAQRTMQPSPDELRSHLEFKLLHKLQSIGATDFSTSHITLSQPSQWDLPSLDLDAFQSLVDDAPSMRIELILVDPATPDADQLLASLRADASVEYQVHVLDAERGGVAQVGELLQLYERVDAVHLIGHGAAAAIQLGSDVLRQDNLDDFRAEISAWRDALSADADILFYGCDVAANDEGRDLLSTIAAWTGADVAGSDDKTGATELAADWQLEFRTGEIDAVMPFAGAVNANWSHSLATIVVTSDADTALPPFGVNSVANLITRDDITLRQAIQAVNYDALWGNKTVHTIAFDLEGTDYTITLGTALPNLSAAVVIDGTTDPNYTDTPVVTLTGKPILLNITGSNIEVRGLVLEGSTDNGIVITGSRNTIVGNHIVDNAKSGIYVKGGSFNIIGGTDSADRNVLSGNEQYGIYLGYSYTAQGNQVIGNYIGVTADGQSAYGNGEYGVGLVHLSTQANATATIVSGNVISANAYGGIYLGAEAYHVDILNNLIGVAADGNTDLGNEGHGIYVKTGPNAGFPGYPVSHVPSDILIQGNTIAHNQGTGVSVENDYTYDVKIIQNQIYANDGLGIDLKGDGVTPNDNRDIDGGPNYLNNFPTLTSVSVVDGKIQITGSISNADKTPGPGPAKPLQIEIHFYYSQSAHTSGHGDAQVYIGTVNVTPDNNGNATFTQAFNAIVPDGSYITATATTDRGTSEFALNVLLPVGNANPINLSPTGAVLISGGMVQGALLTASNTLVDGNGLSGQVRYQWLRNGTAINGANDTEYTLTQADVGAIITLEASYTDDDGFEEVVASADYGPVQNLNDAPIGSVTIDGIAEQGQTLTVEYDLDDPDGNPDSYRYQWSRDGEAIAGATSASYTLTQDDVGKAITVSVIYEDGYGTEESVTSAATDLVANINDSPVGGIDIQGNPKQNETLSVDLNFTDADGVPAQLQYQWYRNGAAIENASGATYTLTQEDVGRFISVVVSFEDLLGGQESLTSAETGPIINTNDAPTGAPVISGTPRQGETLNTNLSFSDPDGLTGNFIYQWYRDGVAIFGATQQQYILTQADVGHQVSVTVFYTDAQGTNEQVSSEPSDVVEDINVAPTGGLTIIGTVVEGQTLNVQNTVNDLDGNPATFEYEWFRNGVAIPGATDASYTLTPDDVGHTITVRTVYVDGGGTQETVTSAPTAPVASFNLAPTGTLVIEGEAEQGQTLRVQNNLIDPDGNPAEFPYQWYRDGVAISGATGETYTLTQADVDATITVRTTYIDGQGAQETVISAATAPVENINDAPTGGLTILGRAEQGRTLTVQNTIADPDGLPATFTYQWFRDDEEIEGVTGGTYTLTEADVGHKIKVITTYVDGYGASALVYSNETGEVANVNDAPIGSLTISGTPKQGEILTLHNDLHDPDGDPASYSYQWLRNGTAISGATGESYELTQEDVGKAIRVRVVYVDGHGTTETVTSAATGLVANTNDAPSGGLTIDGYAEQGRMLTVQNAIADQDGLPNSFTYQWLRNGEAIEDATGSSYVLTEADVGKQISVTTTYTDGGGYTETVTSALTAEVANINDSPTGRLTISGPAQQGQTLTLGNTLRDPDGNPASFSYQWLRNGEPISGAVGTTYVLTQEDVGSNISVRTVYVDGHGTTETITSTPTARIANSNDTPTGGLTIDGFAEQGQILRVENSIVDPDGNPAEFSYQWLRNGVAISGATGNSYELTQEDVGSTITVATTYVDGQGTSETVISDPTAQVENINDAPTGSVVIDGELEVGSTLTATENLDDLDGIPGQLNYQWYRDGVAIDGATAASYQISMEDLGTRLHLEVSYVDGQGTAEQVASEPTAEIGHINAPPVGELALGGVAQEGQLLTATPNLTDADGIASEFTYRWYRDGVLIEGANAATYQLSDADVGSRIHAVVSYTDDFGTQETLASSASAPVTAVNAPPQGQVIIAGNPVLGGTLTLAANLTDANGLSGTITYIWLRDGEPISGATGSTYQITAADSNTTLSVLASYTDDRGFEEEVLSNLLDIPELSVVAPEPEPMPQPQNPVEMPVDSAPAPGRPAPVPTPTQESPAQTDSPADNAPAEDADSEAESRAPIGDLVFSGSDKGRDPQQPLFDNESGGSMDRGGFAMFGSEPDRTLNDRMASAVSSFAASIDKILYSAPGQMLFPSLQDSLALLSNSRYSNDLAQAVQGIKDARPTLTTAIVGGTAAVSTGLSVGYVIWTLRSGILITGLLSSLPAWRFIDPLPILSGRVNAADGDEESLESLVTTDTQLPITQRSITDTQQPPSRGGAD